MKNYFGILNSADDHLLREAISANNYDCYLYMCNFIILFKKKNCKFGQKYILFMKKLFYKGSWISMDYETMCLVEYIQRFIFRVL